MKTIKKIIIENFQCHKKTVLEPAKSGLTVITGPTDRGKSAVVRSLKWLFYNRPQGDDFIRHGANECKVSVELDNDITVMRRRTTSLNQYWINNECFEGFGNDVPEEVQQVLGIYTYEIADNVLYLNIAEQLEGPFLGSSITAPTRAKILGKLAGAETIDKAQKKVGTDIYRADQKQKQLKEDIQKKKEDIEDYSWVEPLGEILNKIEQKLDELKETQSQLNQLKEVQQQLNEVLEKKKQISSSLEKLQLTRTAVNSLESLGEAIQTNKKLVDLFKKLRKNTLDQEEIYYDSKKLSDTEKAKKQLDQLLQCENDLNKYRDIKQKRNNLFTENKKIRSSLAMLNQTSEASKLINQTELKIKDIIQLDRVHDKLFGKLARKKEIINEFLEDLAMVDDSQSIIEYTENCQNKKNTLKRICMNWNNYSNSIEHYNEQIVKQQQKAREYKQKYRNKLSELGVCPTCGADCEKHQIERVI